MSSRAKSRQDEFILKSKGKQAVRADKCSIKSALATGETITSVNVAQLSVDSRANRALLNLAR